MPFELFANDLAGTGIGTLGAAIATTGATTITTLAAAPASLQTAGGQFRIIIDSEEMIVTAGAATTTWTVTRGAEGTTAATHLNGATIYHVVTAASLLAAATPGWQAPGNLGASTTITGAPKASRTKGTLNVASCAVTISLNADEQADLMLVQDGTGGRAATFSGVNVWATNAGGAPQLTGRAAGVVDRFFFENIGGVVYGYWMTETIVSSLRTATPLSPNGAVAERYSRSGFVASSQAVLASGRLSLFAIELLAGQLLTTVTFWSAGTALSAGTAQWFSLWDAARTQLRVTNDDTNVAWAAFTAKTLTLATTYTVPSSGLYYLGIVIVATTPPSLIGVSATSQLNASAPILCGTSTTGLTNPASAPATAAAITADTSAPYAYVS